MEEHVDLVRAHGVRDLLGSGVERAFDVGDFEREQLLQRMKQSVSIAVWRAVHWRGTSAGLSSASSSPDSMARTC